MENGGSKGAESCGWRVFSLVGRKLSAQAKVDGAHSIELGVWVPHGREDLAHRADVLLHTYFLNNLIIDCKDSCAYLVREYFKGWHRVLDAVDVGWYLEPLAESVA